MENNETLPEGFVQMVDCCKCCIHNDTEDYQQLSGWCSKYKICVMIFSICKDYEQTNKRATILTYIVY